MIKEAIEKLDTAEIYSEPKAETVQTATLTEAKIQAVAKELKDWGGGYLSLAAKHGVRRADVYLIDSERKAIITRRRTQAKEPVEEPIEEPIEVIKK